MGTRCGGVLHMLMSGVYWRTGRRSALVVLVGLLGVLTASTADASGPVLTSVSCGATISTDVVLESDVGPCSGTGFTVTGSHVTIDLNGHRVMGAGDLTPSVGIRVVSGTTSDVVIKRGTVTGFGFGVEISGAHRTLVSSMNIVGNTGGLVTSGGGIGHNGGGVRVFFASGSVVRGNRIVGNGPSAGVSVVESADTLIEANVIQGNRVAAVSSGHLGAVVHHRSSGVEIGASTARAPFKDGNVVRGNQIVDNGWHGVQISGFSERNVVVHNQIHRNGREQLVDDRILSFGHGVLVAGFRNIVEGNSITGNGYNGIEAGFSGNVIRRNVAIGNSTSPTSFPSFDLVDRAFGCVGNLWSGNRFGTFGDPCVTAP